MVDTEKLQTLINGKRTPDRLKIMFLLLEKGLTMSDITSLSIKDLSIINEVENGESFFKKYISRKGVMNTIIKSDLLFPSSDGGKLTEEGILTTLRRACRVYGFQLQDLGLDGTKRNNYKQGDIGAMSIEEIQVYLQTQHENQK